MSSYPTFEEWWEKQGLEQPPTTPAAPTPPRPTPPESQAAPLSFEEWWAQQEIAQATPAAPASTPGPENQETEWDFNAARALKQVPASAREFAKNTLAPIIMK